MTLQDIHAETATDTGTSGLGGGAIAGGDGISTGGCEVNDKYHAMALQCYISSMALYSRRLPPGYQIVLRFTQGDYATALLDPDGVQTASDPPQGFAELCEIAQADAKRRASDGIQ